MAPGSPAPSIALVTPCFNSLSFLPAAVDSVLAQGYPTLSYHVQDGGSTDGSCEWLQSKRPRVSWDSAPDQGQAAALNLGFARVAGEVMGWLNSDDVLLPGALAAVGRHFAEHPETDVVYGHRILIDEDGLEIGRWVMPPHDDATLSWGDYVPQETLFWRRALWERTGGRVDPSFAFAIDWELLLRLRSAGARFALLPRFLGAFRVHAAQKTTALMATRGAEEISRLRRQLHGRYVPTGEASRALESFLDRSSIEHYLFRVGLRRL